MNRNQTFSGLGKIYKAHDTKCEHGGRHVSGPVVATVPPPKFPLAASTVATEICYRKLCVCVSLLV